MNDWKKFKETSLPEKEDCRLLAPKKRVCKAFEIKI